MYPTSAVPSKILWPSQNTQSLHPPLGLLCPVGVPLSMGWQRSWQTSFALWLGNLHTMTLKTPYILCRPIQKVKLEPGEVITSYDVKALLTSVPMDPSMST